MPPDRTDPTPDATPPEERRRFDPWEAVVRQELAKARRRRSARFPADEDVGRGGPTLRDPQPGEPAPESP